MAQLRLLPAKSGTHLLRRRLCPKWAPPQPAPPSSVVIQPCGWVEVVSHMAGEMCGASSHIARVRDKAIQTSYLLIQTAKFNKLGIDVPYSMQLQNKPTFKITRKVKLLFLFRSTLYLTEHSRIKVLSRTNGKMFLISLSKKMALHVSADVRDRFTLVNIIGAHV